MTKQDIDEMYIALIEMGLTKEQAYKFLLTHDHKYINYIESESIIKMS